MRGKKRAWILLILLLTAACDQSHEAVTGDTLYVPDGYQSEVSALGLRVIAAKPYYRSPFIAIVEDSEGKQSAMIFRDQEKPELIALPKTYEEIVEQLGQNEKPLTQISKENIFLLEINGKLYWNYESSERGSVYLNLEGIEQSPFS
ncbi:hypothetical protein CDO73_18150 [Saccharibacillus sp. O23]|uniref:hypothetical protein n=1 Tax=Saccharibacillus sp. O23 TaxID=2009338 RepID=UPI000B4E4588|nr:hypothetical protein [Saccharibacillus sp. O23]OWR28475.1 hypothetical protein CDO73_18150 [Saccharibacillus sp. O23]